MELVQLVAGMVITIIVVTPFAYGAVRLVSVAYFRTRLEYLRTKVKILRDSTGGKDNG
jgi:hypothetical protein